LRNLLNFIGDIIKWLRNLKYYTIMSKSFRLLKFTFALIIYILFTGSGCGSTLKTEVHHKKKKSSCNLEQLVGNDRYYYSDHYKRELKKSIKKIGRW